MAITVGTATTATKEGDGHLEIPRPPGVVAGTLLIFSIASRNRDLTATPTGTSLILRQTNGNGLVRLFTYYKWIVNPAGEPAAYDWAAGGLSQDMVGGCLPVFGAENPAVSPIVSAGSDNGVWEKNGVCPSIVPPADGSLCLGTSGHSGDTTASAPSGTSLSWQNSGPNISGVMGHFWHDASATGEKTFVWSSDGSVASQMLGIAPVATSFNPAWSQRSNIFIGGEIV